MRLPAHVPHLEKLFSLPSRGANRQVCAACGGAIQPPRAMRKTIQGVKPSPLSY